ncbi:DUF2218 domain-containing protein [Pseudaminobacter soli (ex Li et al. 2025)]|uniref:DUF2218 domain-containing protein n=1 Tax=Pseudaminobacter soli (ex Li et al. 2025) TaxID=1295366 RepID=A0A2P7SA09_9HYPH|nr:DUF2218 domain-containing protein [Mesorhizobium soli]PSJ59323.1 DUF2218 domain-containing protein [Mesorhizobium soli]
MAKSKAVVETEHASRYLQQLCKHWSHKFAVEFSPTEGRIDLGEGRVVDLRANDASLTVEVEAPELPRMEQVVVDHIVRFAFREDLVFDWKPVQ